MKWKQIICLFCGLLDKIILVDWHIRVSGFGDLTYMTEMNETTQTKEKRLWLPRVLITIPYGPRSKSTLRLLRQARSYVKIRGRFICATKLDRPWRSVLDVYVMLLWERKYIRGGARSGRSWGYSVVVGLRMEGGMPRMIYGTNCTCSAAPIKREFEEKSTARIQSLRKSVLVPLLNPWFFL